MAVVTRGRMYPKRNTERVSSSWAQSHDARYKRAIAILARPSIFRAETQHEFRALAFACMKDAGVLSPTTAVTDFSAVRLLSDCADIACGWDYSPELMDLLAILLSCGNRFKVESMGLRDRAMAELERLNVTISAHEAEIQRLTAEGV